MATKQSHDKNENNCVINFLDRGWGGRTRTSEWRNQKSPGQFDLAKFFSQLMVKACMSHQRVMSNFPTGRMVGKAGLEIPGNAADPTLKQQRFRPSCDSRYVCA